MSYSKKTSYFQPTQLIFELLLLFCILFYYIDIQYLDEGVAKTLQELVEGHYKAFIILSISWYFIGSYFNLYKWDRGNTLAFLMENTFYQILIFSVLLFAVSGIKSYDLLSIANSIYFLMTFLAAIYILRISFFFIGRKLVEKGWGNVNVLMVDENSNTLNFKKMFEDRKDLGYQVIGEIYKNNEALENEDKLLQHIEKEIKMKKIELIFLSLSGQFKEKTVEDIKLMASKNKVGINFIPSMAMLGYNDLYMNYIYTYPVLKEIRNPLDFFWNRFMKRLLDIIVAIFGLVILSSTVFPVVGLLIYLDSGLPIFFRQKRKGVDGKTFYCYKFRTMVINKDSNDKITTRNDSRITKIGKFLRQTSIDELPQLFNVLIGDMSLVGPRPHMVKQDDLYDEIINYYSLRNHVKPGITGLAQISGYRGEINSKKDMENRVRSDIYYIRNWTFSLDLIIIVKTFLNTIKGDENAI